MVDGKWFSMWNILMIVVTMVFTFDVCLSSLCHLEPLYIKDKSTSQSSTYHEYPAENAVDGDVTTFSKTVDDGTDSNPWWQLELEGEYWLGRITVIICKDSCDDYFNGVVVRAGLNNTYNENEQCTSSVTNPSDGAVVEFLCDPPALAKYISLDKDLANLTHGGTGLKIAEVLVYENASKECAIQSEAFRLNGILTSQSTSNIMYPASRAKDGNVNTHANTDSCCDPHPWWMLDLGNRSWVGTIIVTIRLSCCGSRFRGAIARAGMNETVSVNSQCGLAVTNEQASVGAVIQFKCFPPLSAQYISLEVNQTITPKLSPSLEIAEVAVKQYKSEECVPNNTLTFNDNSTSASSYKNPAQDAFDGNINTFTVTTAKQSESQHWWMLDLGATHWVGKVTVIFKSVEGFTNAEVLVRTGNSLNYTENTPCGELMVNRYTPMEFVCTKLTFARYVSVDVKLPPQKVLQIAEVFIKEFASGDCRASSKAEVTATSQSKDLQEADRATDGNVNTYSLTGTSAGQTWWQMELTNESWLTRVTVILRSTTEHSFIGAVARVGQSPDNLNVTCGSPATERQCVSGAVIQFLCDRPTLARYVSLSKGVGQSTLEIAEVTVDDYETEECAPTNDATSNSLTAWQTGNKVLSSANAIDGQVKTFFETAHGDDHPWWKLDLGNDYWLGVIAVTLRADCCGNRFLGVVARAGPYIDYTMNRPCALAGEPTNKAGSVVEFLCNPPVSARYISLDIDRSGPGVIHAMLQIAEVIVKEYNSQECVTNDTLGASDWTATQSSESINKPARDATDENISTYSRTLPELHPWWRLNLESEQWLGKITLILAASKSDSTLKVRAGTSTNYEENTQCFSSVTETEYKTGAVIEHVCDPPIKARYITVDVNHTNSFRLQIAYVAVKTYASEDCARNSTSTAIKGKARQSTGVEKHPASKANDGNTGTYFKSANFADDPHPWWQVDLVDQHCIGRITVKFKDNTTVGNLTAMVSAEDDTDFSTNQQCGLQWAQTRVNDLETAQYFLCEPPFLAKYIILAVNSSFVPTVEQAYLQIAEVTVEQHSSAVGACLKWDDPNRKTKSAYISKKFKGTLSTSKGARKPLTEVSSSLKQCVTHCLNHNSCISFVFSELGGECSLYSQYQSALYSPSDEEDSYWVYDLSE